MRLGKDLFSSRTNHDRITVFLLRASGGLVSWKAPALLFVLFPLFPALSVSLSLSLSLSLALSRSQLHAA